MRAAPEVFNRNRALPGEREGDLLTDAARGTRDHGEPAFSCAIGSPRRCAWRKPTLSWTAYKELIPGERAVVDEALIGTVIDEPALPGVCDRVVQLKHCSCR